MPNPYCAEGPFRILTDALSDFHPTGTSDMVHQTSYLLESLDARALAMVEEALGERRCDVFRMCDQRFAVPPGAGQCPQASVQTFGPVHLISAGSVFTTLLFDFGLVSGKYMYEIGLCTDEALQVGFSAPMNLFPWDDTKGVGSFPFTVAYDGYNCKLHNVGTTAVGWKWMRGDMIGVTFDLDIGEVTYYQNGKLVTSCSLPTIKSMMAAGVPHSDKDIELCYFPAISMAPWQQCRFNAGGFPFIFPIPGFKGMDVGYEGRHMTWVPRLGVLDRFPTHLERYRHVVEQLMVQRAIATPATEFLQFYTCAVEYLTALLLRDPSRQRATALMATLRRVLPEDMFDGMVSMFMSCLCIFSSFCAERIPVMAVSDEDTNTDVVSPATFPATHAADVIGFLLDVAPGGIPYWLANPCFFFDLMTFADVREPNEKDLRDWFPLFNTRDPTLFTNEGMSRIYAEQEKVANHVLGPDQTSRQRIVGRIMCYPGVRAQVALLLYKLWSEVKEAVRNPSKRNTFQVYSERRILHFLCHILSGLRSHLADADDQTIANTLLPLSVLKLPTEEDNLSGISHADLVARDGASLFANVPDIMPNSPECLAILFVELFHLFVKSDILKVLGEIAENDANRRWYAAQVDDGNEHTPEAEAMLTHLIENTRRLSWVMASLFLPEQHTTLVGFSSFVFRAISYYDQTPYVNYVPARLLETALDLIHLSRRTCPSHSVIVGLEPHIILFMMKHFRSPVIQHQAMRDYLLMTAGGVPPIDEIHRRQGLSVMANHKPIVHRFIANVFDQFADPLAWTLVVNLLYEYNSGNSFCMPHRILDEEWPVVFFMPGSIPAEEYTSYEVIFTRMQEYLTWPSSWAGESPTCSPLSFFRSCMTHSNWCVTELCAIVKAILENPDDIGDEATARRRRAVAVFGYTTKMLHICAGLVWLGFNFFFNTTDNNAGTVPSHNAPPISASSKALLVVELVGQCLSRFATPSSPMYALKERHIVGMERLDGAMIVAPIVSNMMRMMGDGTEAHVAVTSHLTAKGAMALWRDRHSDGFDGIPASVIAYVEELVRTNVFFRQMAQPRVDWNHACVTYALTGIDWAEVCRKAHSNSNLLKALPLTAMAYEALQEERQSRLEAASDTSGGAALCPICCVSGLEVVFEPCGHSSCLPCIERHQISDRRCFFCKVDVQSTRPYVSSAGLKTA